MFREIGIDISAHRSKGLEAINAGTIDTVITLCAEEVCPAFLGKAIRLHWGLPDLTAAEGDEITGLATNHGEKCGLAG